MRVSVALCTYNGASYLGAQLDSIAWQTHIPDELCVRDDLSSDHTRELIEGFKGNSSFPVRVITNRERLGPARNFEAAIGDCTGDIVLLADQDDIWAQHRVEAMCALFREDEGLWAACSNAQLIGRSGGKELWQRIGVRNLDTVTKEALFARLLRGNVAVGATLALRSRARPMLMPICSGWMHDYWIAMLSASTGRLGITGQRLVQYRVHERNVVGFRGESWIGRTYHRGDRFVRVSRAWEALAGRLVELLELVDEREGWDARLACELVARRAEFFRERADVCTRDFLARMQFASTRYRDGDYHRYSSGLASALLDAAGMELGSVVGA